MQITSEQAFAIIGEQYLELRATRDSLQKVYAEFAKVKQENEELKAEIEKLKTPEAAQVIVEH